jgi:hypothetical protein
MSPFQVMTKNDSSILQISYCNYKSHCTTVDYDKTIPALRKQPKYELYRWQHGGIKIKKVDEEERVQLYE